MANNDAQDAKLVKAKSEAKSKTFYFKSKLSGLRVPYDVGDGVIPSTYKFERFTAYKDTWKGNPIKVGYLETENKVVIQKCRDDRHCEEIDKKEYDKAVKELEVAPRPAV